MSIMGWGFRIWPPASKHPRDLLLKALREHGPMTGRQLVEETGLYEIGTPGICGHMVVLRKWGKVRAVGTRTCQIYELESE